MCFDGSMEANPNPETECQGSWREVVILTPAFADWQLMRCSGCGELWAIHHGTFPQFQVTLEPNKDMDVVSALLHADLALVTQVAS